MIRIIGATEFSDYFLGYIPAYIFTIVRLVLFLLLFNFSKQFKTGHVVVSIVLGYWRGDANNEWSRFFGLDRLIK